MNFGTDGMKGCARIAELEMFRVSRVLARGNWNFQAANGY